MTDFERAYKAWREKPFPPGSRSDPLDELHADLALVDTWVAEAIVPYVENGVQGPIQVDPLEKLQQIRDRATELAKSGTADDKRLVNDYVRYADSLREVYERFLSTIEPRT